MNARYILEGRQPNPVDDVIQWARWFETADRRVARTDLPGGVEVSTVFLGLDHSFGLAKTPILFETMVFGGKYDQYEERYATWEEAEEGHSRAVAMVT